MPGNTKKKEKSFKETISEPETVRKVIKFFWFFVVGMVLISMITSMLYMAFYY